MEDMRRGQIPAFGNWDYCSELPITQYFESAVQAGLIKGHYFGEDEDLFKIPAPEKPAYHHKHHHHRNPRKVKKGGGGGGGEKQYGQEQQRKQGKVCDMAAAPPTRRTRAPKAVDEDLYKIPPELLYQKPKRKRMLRTLLSGCLGLSCIA